jgi:hypothetical protein
VRLGEQQPRAVRRPRQRQHSIGGGGGGGSGGRRADAEENAGDGAEVGEVLVRVLALQCRRSSRMSDEMNCGELCCSLDVKNPDHDICSRF